MPASLDTRPPGVNNSFRPGNPAEATIVFPGGTLAGRTFTATLAGTALTGGNGSLVVAGDTMTVTATAALTTTLTVARHELLITETTGGGSKRVFIGSWYGSNSPNVTGVVTVQVVAGTGATVSVTGGPQAFAPDLVMSPVVIGGGTAHDGIIRRTHSIQIPWTYTLTTAPTDSAIGTAVHVPITVTVDNNGGGIGPQFQTGHFGPRGIFNIEGAARYAQNMTTLGFAPVSFADFLTIANTAGVARTLRPSWSHLSARSVVADAAVVTLAPNDSANGGAAFVDSPVFASMNTGRIDGTTNSYEATGIRLGLALVGDVDLTRRIGLDVFGTTGGGGGSHWDIAGTIDADSTSLAEEIGIRVGLFGKATTKIGIQTAHPIDLLSASQTATGVLSAIVTPSTRVLTMTTSGLVQGFAFGPTIVFEDDANVFGCGQLFQASPIVKNAAGEAHALGTLGGWTTVNSTPTFRADNAAVSMPDYLAFKDAAIVDRLSAGVFTLTAAKSFVSSLDVGTGNTVTTRTVFQATDATGAGTLTNQIVIDIPVLAKGSTLNIGIRNAAPYVATPTAQTLSAAGNAITANAEVKALTNSTGGSLTLTSAPTIADGQTGQEVELVNVGAQDIVIQDQGTLASSNLRLVAATITLTPRDTVRLRYNATVGDWVQSSPVTVVL